MKSSKYKVVICPPCGEQSLAPEGFNPGVAVAAKEEECLMAPPTPRCGTPSTGEGDETHLEDVF